MSVVRQARSAGDARSEGDPESSLLAPSTRIGPLGPREGSVVRARTVDWLASHADVPVVAVVAPAGYGKTTLLQQWTDRDPRASAWLHLDMQDNDPTVLLTELALAMGRIFPVDAAVLRSFTAPRHSSVHATSRLLSMLDQSPESGVLVLDDIHRIENAECHAIIAALVERLPPDWQMAIAGREQPERWLPVARLRAEGRVVEIGAEDLAMDDEEASELVDAAGVVLDRADVVALNRRAEGWPVALYLAALAIASGRKAELGRGWQGGTDRFMADYLLSEVLAGMPPSTVDFLIRTSLPERLSGPLCDALLETDGSADRLISLERKNALVIPLDRQRRWYRYHHLFRELLGAELERRAPDQVVVLRRRAADWYEANGSPELAIDEAMELGDAPRVARLVAAHAQSFYQAGREATIQRWLDWIDQRNLMTRYPNVAVTGAMVHILAGRAAAAARWMNAVERSVMPDGRPSVENSELEGDLAMLRAASCREGPEGMRRDAADAVRLMALESPWRAASLALLGTAHYLMDELEEADRVLGEAVDAAADRGATVTVSIALVELALLAERGGHTDARDVLADRALAVVDDNGLDDYATSALAVALSGRIRIEHGDVRAAKALLVRAQRLRVNLTHALPVYAVQARLELARAYVSITDVAGARTILREAVDIAQRRRLAGELLDEIAALQLQLDTLRGSVIGASSLTAAELRLLPLLATNLTFRKIGERLFISPNTVKTEAIAIYRKLGVSSRGEAVTQAHALGLLEP